MMSYQEAVNFLFSATPVFQRDGASAYKPGLDTIRALDERYNHPHRSYKTIHVGGTNGKGTTSHTLAAILQRAGLKVGLFTSPHLVDFRERIRVNGEMVSEDFVCRFVEDIRDTVQTLKPSFFELTTMMALCYFREQKVEVAIIEVGLGGRLDSTNIIDPLLSIITSISLDHTQLLGDTLEAIAREKAGIIKPNGHIILGETDEASYRVIKARAEEMNAHFMYAPDHLPTHKISDITSYDGAQRKCLPIIHTALPFLSHAYPERASYADHISKEEVTRLTGLRGRWEKASYRSMPLTCDTAHNPDGIRLALEQIDLEANNDCTRTHIVLGLSADKDIEAILHLLLPKAQKPTDKDRVLEALQALQGSQTTSQQSIEGADRGKDEDATSYHFYWTAASSPRSLPAEALRCQALALGIKGEAYAGVGQALDAVRSVYSEGDRVYLFGSNFLIADFLQLGIQEDV